MCVALYSYPDNISSPCFSYTSPYSINTISVTDMFMILQEEVSEFPGPKTESKSGG